MFPKSKSDSQLQYLDHESLRQTITNQFHTPVFICMLICGTLTLLFGFVSFLNRNPISDLLTLLHQLPLSIQEALSPLESVIAAARGIQIALLLCGTVTAAGFWIIFLSSKFNADTQAYRIGFTAIEIVKFNQLVVSLFIMPLAAIQTYNILGSVKNYVGEVGLQTAASRIEFLRIIVVVVAIGTIIHLFDVLLTFMLLKDSVCTVSVNSQMTFYSPIYCFLISAVLLYVLFEIGFNIAAILACASLILFGVFIIQYRSKMLHFQ